LFRISLQDQGHGPSPKMAPWRASRRCAAAPPSGRDSLANVHFVRLFSFGGRRRGAPPRLARPRPPRRRVPFRDGCRAGRFRIGTTAPIRRCAIDSSRGTPT
jgi:hypothetical protein